MGYYINGIGVTKEEKVAALIANHSATLTDASFKSNLVCIVDNGPFAAAGWCHSYKEFLHFNDPGDRRPKTWLIVPNVEKLVQ